MQYNDKQTDQQLKETPNRRITNVLKEIWDTPNVCEFGMVFEETGPTNTSSKYPLTPHPVSPEIEKIRMWYDPKLVLLTGLQLFH